MAEANMAAVERIKAAKDRSLKLMRMDKSLDEIAKGNRVSIESSINEGQAVGVAPTQDAPQVSPARPFNTNRGMSGMGADKIPSAIKESFMKNPPADDSKLYESVMSDGRSVSMLDQIFPQQQRKATMSAQPRQQIQEVVQQPQQYPSQIDYSVIRAIVEESVRKYTSSLGKKLMNEGTGGELNTLTIGKTFKFLDSKGNIYEAKLTKIGNINDKKKVNG